MKAKKGFFALILFVFLVSILIYCQREPQNTVKSHDGVRISYRSQGSGNPPLFFVHGWSGDRSYWEAQVDYFARNYRVVTIDLAGHGESGLNRKDWTIESFGKDIERFGKGKTMFLTMFLLIAPILIYGIGNVVRRSKRNNPG